jgi:copper(I)-binding protein
VSRGSSAAPAARRTALVAVGLALTVSGCAAGQLAQTAYQESTVGGSNGQAGPIALRNITVAYPDGGRYHKGDSGRLEFFVVNESDQADRLVDIRTDAAERVTFSGPSTSGSDTASATATPPPTTTPPATGSSSSTATPSGAGTTSATATSSAPAPAAVPIPLPPQALTSCWGSGAVVTLVGLTRPLLPADIVAITFVFDRAGEVTVNVPVGAPSSPLPPAPTIDVNGETTSAG